MVLGAFILESLNGKLLMFKLSRLYGIVLEIYLGLLSPLASYSADLDHV